MRHLRAQLAECKAKNPHRIHAIHPAICIVCTETHTDTDSDAQT